jgi:hypothetical protein
MTKATEEAKILEMQPSRTLRRSRERDANRVDDGTGEILRSRRLTTGVRSGINRKVKSATKLCKKSDEVIVPIIGRTAKPVIGKGLCFNGAFARR